MLSDKEKLWIEARAYMAAARACIDRALDNSVTMNPTGTIPNRIADARALLDEAEARLKALQAKPVDEED